MTDNTFLDIINKKNIRIPKIQRDYAQGRKSPKVNEIRKNFVHSLIKTVKGEVTKQELDFVYGNERNNAFEPLDGQQRLTTLFLLHWILGVNLKNTDLDSKFTYETITDDESFFEAHEKFLDIHLMLEGSERVEVAPPAALEQYEAQPQNDFYAYRGEGHYKMTLAPGDFVVVFPADAHKIKMQVNGPETVTKAVFKVKIS